MRKTTLVRSLFTLLLFTLVSFGVKGQESQVIYYEDFGNKGGGVALNLYDGFSSTLIKPTGAGWLVNSGTGNTGSFASIGASGEAEMLFDFNNKLSYFSNVTLQFNYYRASSSANPLPLELYFSSDGGSVWEKIEVTGQSFGKWLSFEYTVESKYLTNFQMKISKVGTCITRVDDVKLAGMLYNVTECADPVISSGIYSANNELEVPRGMSVEIACETPSSKISYQIDNENVITLPSPVNVVVEKDCSIKYSASVGEITTPESACNIKILTESKKIIFTSELDGVRYALYPKLKGATTLEAHDVILADNQELVLSDLSLVWTVYSSRKNADSYYLYAPNNKYLSQENNGLHLGIDATPWKYNTVKGIYYYTDVAANNQMTFFCRVNANNSVYFATGSVNHQSVLGISSYSLEDCQFVLSGEQNTKLINEVLSDKNLKWIDLSGISSFVGDEEINAPANANCLIFTNQAFGVSLGEVVNGVCEYFEISDNVPFGTPSEFKIQEVSYSRLAWQDNGWETIILPFDVTTLPDQYVFDEYLESTSDVVSFRRVTSLKANTPYLMKFTGPKVDGQARCVFSASNVTVSPIMNNSDFTGVYEKTSTNGKYILTVSGGQTVFKLGGSKSAVNPFRAYLDINRPAGAAPLRVVNLPADATGVEDVIEEQFAVWNGESGEIVVNNPVAQFVNVMSIDGRIVKSLKLEAGKYVIDGLPAGLCIINGKKIIVK